MYFYEIYTQQDEQGTYEEYVLVYVKFQVFSWLCLKKKNNDNFSSNLSEQLFLGYRVRPM